jgi:hypothetical protein
VVSCIRCGCAEGWHTGYDGPCLNAGCRCRAYEPDWAELDALAVEDVLDGFPAPGVTLRYLRPASRAVTAHLVELTEPSFFWPLDHQPQHAAEVQRDERLLAEQEEAGSRPADRTSQAPLAQRIVRQPSELVDGSSNLSGGTSRQEGAKFQGHTVSGGSALPRVAQLDRAGASEAPGRPFESDRAGTVRCTTYSGPGRARVDRSSSTDDGGPQRLGRVPDGARKPALTAGRDVGAGTGATGGGGESPRAGRGRTRPSVTWPCAVYTSGT